MYMHTYSQINRQELMKKCIMSRTHISNTCTWKFRQKAERRIPGSKTIKTPKWKYTLYINNNVFALIS